MNILLLQPTDVLFFCDGRPMSGSLAGHTEAWPLPNITSAALHAALHRADLPDTHVHRRARSGRILSEDRDKDGRKFGSLMCVGPFPVCEGKEERWYFPRPADAQIEGSTTTSLFPLRPLAGDNDPLPFGNLPKPLLYASANNAPPDKGNQPEAWLAKAAMDAYLTGKKPAAAPGLFAKDGDFSDREQQVGIAIDPETETAGTGEAVGRIYSAHYLRLREGWRLGLLAAAEDKGAGKDLLSEVISQNHRILIGGQQRICTATLRKNMKGTLPLPTGLGSAKDFQQLPNGKFAVKWILLSPAVWPEICADVQRGISEHAGGWLPNWINPNAGQVLLKAGDTERGPGEAREAWRARVRGMKPMAARLVAAIVPKPLVVTGWSLGDERLGEEGKPGAKSTHLAVPAGAVYYFEAESPEAAAALAAALNWHGATSATEVENRRSTLLGEKGYGLGMCGTWKFFGT